MDLMLVHNCSIGDPRHLFNNDLVTGLHPGNKKGVHFWKFWQISSNKIVNLADFSDKILNLVDFSR